MIINTGTKLILVSFPLWNGFQNTLLSNRLQFSVSQTKSIQIHHFCGNHWVTSASDETGEVTLYDSLFLGDISQDVQAQLASIYRTEKDIREVKVASVYKQKSGCDCGLFALAFAVDVAPGIDPSYVRYRQSEMRQHLLQCILKGTITSFPPFMPGERGAVTDKRLRPAIVAIAVNCICRLPEEFSSPTVSFLKCQKLVHMRCVKAEKLCSSTYLCASCRHGKCMHGCSVTFC